MLDEGRVTEAGNNVKQYIADRLMKRVSKKDENVLKVLLNKAKESLKVAEDIFNNNHSSLWTIVCSYYSMYYAARAALYNLGYNISYKISHKITADALIAYARDKLKNSLQEEYEELQEEALELASVKADELIESFDYERKKRSKFQYEITESVKKAKAKTSLERAKKFLLEMEKLIE